MNYKLLVELLGETLELVIRVIAEKGNDEVKDLLVGLTPLLAALQTGDLATVNVPEARAEIDKLKAELAADRAEADNALARKFDIEGDGL